MVTFPMTNESEIHFSHADSLRREPIFLPASPSCPPNYSQWMQLGQIGQEVSDTLPSWLPGCGPV